MPPCYTEHSSVCNAAPDDLPQPISMYVDGVAYSRTDTAIGIWCHFALSKTRHLIAVLRKSECLGWDTFYPVWLMIAWSLEHMLNGVYPSQRHDGAEFTAGDQHRADLSGTRLPFKAVCLWIKSDISEYSATFGLPGLGDAISSCPFCFSSSDDLDAFYRTSDLSAEGAGFPEKTAAVYDHACTSCETVIRLSPADRSTVVRNLHYSKNKRGPGGRSLLVDLPHLGLRKRMRVEPSKYLANVAALEMVDHNVDVVFWDHTKDTTCRHRNPILSAATGVTIKALGIDWMHSIALGPAQFVLHPLMWAIIVANIFIIVGGSDSVAELSFARIRDELFTWYEAESKAGRQSPETHTIVLR